MTQALTANELRKQIQASFPSAVAQTFRPDVLSNRYVIFPFRPTPSAPPVPAIAYQLVVQDGIDGEHHNVVIACWKEGAAFRFKVNCGDLFLTGQSNADDDMRTALGGSRYPRAEPEWRAAAKSLPVDGACSFHTDGTCAHTRASLFNLKQQSQAATGEDVVEQLQQKWEASYGTARGANGEIVHPLVERMTRHIKRGINWLLCGRRGVGKTFIGRHLARTVDATLIEAFCSPAMLAEDFIGGLKPYGETGTFVWMDGPLAEAFRRAGEGHQVILLLDEMLRAEPRQLSILLSALSPDDGEYRLPIDRIVDVHNGVGRREVLSCPTANLTVVATTNRGSRYQVGEVDPAVEDRFVVVTMESDAEEAVNVLAGKFKERGFGHDTLEALTRIVEGASILADNGELRESINTRSLSRALDMAEHGDKSSLELELAGHFELWVARDSNGVPLQDQKETVVKLIADGFAGRLRAPVVA